MTDKSSFEYSPKLIRFAGMEMHNPLFFLSAALVLIFSTLTLIFPDQANSALHGAKNWSLRNFDWLYAITPIVVFFICVGLAISPLGRVRLGGNDAKPEFSILSWVAMLFAAGVGIGFMFYGAAEPLGYFTNWFGTPFNLESGSEELRHFSFATSIFHWGILAWAVYAIVGISLAYFTFNRGLPLSVRSIFYPLLGNKIYGLAGDFIDLLAVISTIFGAGLYHRNRRHSGQRRPFIYIRNNIFHRASNRVDHRHYDRGDCVCYTGLSGGIKILSNINMVAAGLLLAFVLLFGPTMDISNHDQFNRKHHSRHGQTGQLDRETGSTISV